MPSVRIQIGDYELLVAHASDVVHFDLGDELHAAEWLRRRLASALWPDRVLRELAELVSRRDSGFDPFERDRDRVLARAGRLLARETLFAVHVRELFEEDRQLDAPHVEDLRSRARARDENLDPRDRGRAVVPAKPPATARTRPIPEHALPTTHLLSLVLVSEEGKPLGDVSLRIVLPDTREVDARSDSDGRISIENLPFAGAAVLTLAHLIRLPAFEPGETPNALDGIRISRDREAPFELSTNRNHVVVVERPRVDMVELSGCFEEARSVLVFGRARSTEGEATSVRAVLRTALLLAQGRTLCVAGHTDTRGTGHDNEVLAASRAESVQLYLAGNRDPWAAHAAANATVADLQTALIWAASTFGIACHPGPVDNDWGEQTAEGLNGFRDHVGISREQPLGADDWAAVFDLYERDLAAILLTDPAQVSTLRRGVKRTQPPWIAYGERWPIESAGVDDKVGPRNRRVDILVFDEAHLPRLASHDPKGDEVYDGTYRVSPQVAAVEAPVELRVVRSGTLSPLSGGRARVGVGTLGVRTFVADAAGIVRFVALHGDRIVVVAAEDSSGAGMQVGHGFIEAGKDGA
jgi:hypothetical protein